MSDKAKGMIFSAVLIIIGLLLLPIAIDSTHDAQTDIQSDAFVGVAVAAGAADVTLTQSLWNNAVAEVNSITASGVGAVPVAASYTPATKVLHITGLGADNPQNITVNYNYDGNTAYNGVNAILELIPLLIVVGLIIVAIINGMWTLKTK